jgi:hypothetical protein
MVGPKRSERKEKMTKGENQENPKEKEKAKEI